MFCPKCGIENPDEARFCGGCGESMPGKPPASEARGDYRPSRRGGATSAQSADSKRIVAGIIGIILGSLGIHKFILGYTQAGVIMLLMGTLGWFLIVPAIASSIIGLVEGIIYLTKTDAEFNRIYVDGQRAWF